MGSCRGGEGWDGINYSDHAKKASSLYYSLMYCTVNYTFSSGICLVVIKLKRDISLFIGA